jgi:hypothetical protein
LLIVNVAAGSVVAGVAAAAVVFIPGVVEVSL